jgi:mono/diheme cytochrome c family protein
MRGFAKAFVFSALLGVLALPSIGADIATTPAVADDNEGEYAHKPEAQDFIHGAPEAPTEAWTLAAGGRIYDNWWEALDREEPKTTHPNYPKTGKQEGAVTWRCKECHAWDYRGKDGIYGKGSHFTGFPGIDGAIGKPVEAIAAALRDKTHGYTVEMIKDDELARVAAFVSRGQVDMGKYVDLKTRKIIAGNVDRGREIFQTTCAACHGFDGRLLNWGSKEEPAYVGTEGRDVPDEVLHKILNAHTGVQMINLRAFPVENAVDVLAYTATLPEK